jgi:hypothetical protein
MLVPIDSIFYLQLEVNVLHCSESNAHVENGRCTTEGRAGSMELPRGIQNGAINPREDSY